MIGGCGESPELVYQNDDWYGFFNCWSNQVKSGWFSKVSPENAVKMLRDFRPGNHEKEVSALETRLGLHLPQSYRDMMVLLNGNAGLALKVEEGGGLFGAEEVVPFSEAREPERISYEVYAQNDIGFYEGGGDYFAYDEAGKTTLGVKHADIKDLILIGTLSDVGLLLLNPKHVVDGEWEAVFLTWKDNHVRYKSFRHLMRDMYRGEKPPFSMARCAGFIRG